MTILNAYKDQLNDIDNSKLAELTGTEKQIAWANDIRISIICRLGAKKVMGYQMFLDAMNCATEASWWIDNYQDGTFGVTAGDALKVFEQFINK
jgi:hypothetical protein